MVYRPPEVVGLGITMIFLAAFDFLNGFYQLFYVMSLSMVLFPFTYPIFPSFILQFIIDVVLLVAAVGILSMTRWGYYTALVSSVILIALSPLLLIFVFTLIIKVFINLGSLIFLIIGIIALVYLAGDAKYAYPI
nr:hypothetical protein [Candidatus Freyarchaeota archaeon]